MNHLEVWSMEREWDRGTKRWERWIDEVEKLTGIANLDGDSAVDGYSLDEMHGIYMCDAPPREAAAQIRRNRAKLNLPN